MPACEYWQRLGFPTGLVKRVSRPSRKLFRPSASVSGSSSKRMKWVWSGFKSYSFCWGTPPLLKTVCACVCCITRTSRCRVKQNHDAKSFHCTISRLRTFHPLKWNYAAPWCKQKMKSSQPWWLIKTFDMGLTIQCWMLILFQAYFQQMDKILIPTTPQCLWNLKLTNRSGKLSA